jgi:hypothetical protein
LAFDQLLGRTQAQLEAIHDRTEAGCERVATADHAGLAAVPRKLLLAVGGNDERFDYWGKEDLDLAARLKRAGATYVYDAGLKSFHISHPPNHVKHADYVRMCALVEENNAHELIEVNQGRLWGALNPPPKEILKGTIIIEGGANTSDLARRLAAALYSPKVEEYEVLVACLENDRGTVEPLVHRRYRPVPLISLASTDPSQHAARVLRQVRTEKTSFLPVGASFSPPNWDALRVDTLPMCAWEAELAIGPEQHLTPPVAPIGWLAMSEWLRQLGDFGPMPQWTLQCLIARGQREEQSLANATVHAS